MADERWQRQWDIFHAAIALQVDERSGFVARQCAGDAELKTAVLGLLAAHDDTNPILNEPLLSMAMLSDGLEPESLVGQSIDDYVIRSVIGEGGMGVVYEAKQGQLDRTVALKLIRLGMDTRQVVARFEAERQALAAMKHPNIAKVLDAGTTESGRPYFVMELIDGVPITAYCDKERLDTAQRLELFIPVCAGVQHAHQKGIIHRDLKPTNVLVTLEDGNPVPKIIDFGIAKATAQRMTERTLFTQAGVFIGTPEYMSPEQASSSEQDVDTRTDVYSLGILLYELLVGALPFEPSELRHAGYDEICRRIREDEPSRPSLKLSTLQERAGELAQNRQTDSLSLLRQVRGDLDWITMRALEKNPERRYASPSELAADLRRHMNNEPVEAGPPSTAYRIRKFVRRHTVAVVAGSMVAVSLLLGIAAATFGLLRAQQAERVAVAEARTSEEVTNFLTGIFRAAEPGAVDVGSVTARDVLDRGVERIRSELGDEPAVQSRLMQEMGKVYAQLGLLEEAERLYEGALEIRQSLSSVTDADIAETIAGIANVNFLAGEYERAIELYRDAIERAEASDEEIDMRWLATAYGNMGSAFDTLARNAKALSVLQTARNMLETSGHDTSREYGRVLRNIGISQWRSNDFEAARESYEAALSVYEQSLEPGHPEISYVVNSLAILNYNLKDFEAAKPMFERGLANLERTLGPEHRDTASMMNNLGLLLLEMDLIEEARPKIEESLRIREVVLGPDHEEVATSLCNLANLRMKEHDTESAQTSVDRCLSIREEKLGPNHPYVATALELYAEVLSEFGDSDAALEMEQRASSIRAATSQLPQGTE